MARRTDIFLSFLTWDGIVPLLVVALGWMTRTFVPNHDLAEITSVVFLPIFASLVRAGIGRRQLLLLMGHNPPVSRHVSFAIAIIILLFFEIGCGMLQAIDDEPPTAWWNVLLLYVAYLGLIVFTFRPATAGETP